MLYEYESVFYPVPPDKTDFDWNRWCILSLPTDKLLLKIQEKERSFDEWRKREPSRKRKNKWKYRAWISVSHDYLELIRDMYQEIEKRKTDTAEE